MNGQDISNPIQQSALKQQVIPFWRVPWQFAVHALVGIAIFAIIAGGAVALELAVRALAMHGIGPVIIFGLKAAEYAVFGVDLILFGVFLWRTTKRSVQQL